MKFLSASIALLSTLAIFHQPFVHAAEDTAVFYSDNTVSITDHTQCIPLKKDDLDVTFVNFGVNVECHAYESDDCSGNPVEEAAKPFDANSDIQASEFNNAGSIKC